MNSKKRSLKELHKRAIEVAERINQDEKKLIKEIVEFSPNSIMYLGYIPVHIRYSHTLK